MLIELGSKFVICLDKNHFDAKERLLEVTPDVFVKELHFVELTIVETKKSPFLYDKTQEGNGYRAIGSDGNKWYNNWIRFDDSSNWPIQYWHRPHEMNAHPDSEPIDHGMFHGWIMGSYIGFPPVLREPIVARVNELFPDSRIFICDAVDPVQEDWPNQVTSHRRLGFQHVRYGCFLCNRE